MRIYVSDSLWSKQPPLWSPASFGCSDHIEEYDLIIKNLKSFKKEELELIAVCGGLKFFDLMAEIDFCRITLFDKNICELQAFIRIAEYLEKTDFAQFDGFLSIQNEVLSNPAAFYLPSCVQGKVQLEMGVNCDISNTNFRWTPTETQYELVKQRLKAVNTILYTTFPDLDVGGRKVAVFLPNYVFKPIRVRNSALVIPIYTRKVDNPKLSTTELRNIAISKNKKKEKKLSRNRKR